MLFTKRQLRFANRASREWRKHSRKEKKALLGFRLSKSKIKKLLQGTALIGRGIDTIIDPYPFCPVCGCAHVDWVHHSVAYPERWETGYCARCGQKVCESDNSPYVHILEWILGEDQMPIKEACEEF